jgi:hypothetical protein
VRVAQQKLRILGIVFGLAIFACLSLALDAGTAAAAARLKVLDATASESASALRFKVRLIGNTERPVRVSYGTASGTATAGTDFSTVMGQLAFQPETAKRLIVVKIIPDSIPEGKETLSVRLWKPIGATIARGRATGTIRDDDGSPVRAGSGVENPPQPTPPRVLINEILPDPKGVESEYEYVELLNAENSPVNLDGWTINAGAGCPLTGVLAPNGLYVVSNDPLIRDSACPLALADTGGTITVRDGPAGSGSVVDSVDYSGYPITPGESLSLDPSRADPAQNDLVASWCTAKQAGATLYGPSENYGSPGALNGPCQN